MSSTAPVFKSIDFNTIKKAVKEVATEQNIPKLTYPTDAPQAAAAPAATPDVPEVVATSKRVRKGSGPARMVRIAVDLPDYLVKAIAKDSVEKGVTKRYLYLSAFRTAGFVIHDIDMQEDGRRETTA